MSLATTISVGCCHWCHIEERGFFSSSFSKTTNVGCCDSLDNEAVCILASLAVLDVLAGLKVITTITTSKNTALYCHYQL